jgi:hypothetical protein
VLRWLGRQFGGQPDDGPAGKPQAEPEAEARREAVAEEFLKEVLKPLEDRRGDETTRRGNDIVAQECRKVLNEAYPDLAGTIKHVAGATKDGEGKTKLPERNVRKEGAPYPGGNFPDLTWQRGDDEKDRAHANTVSMQKRETKPTKEERDALEAIREVVGQELMTDIPKFRPGMDEEEYRKLANAKCREIFGRWLGPPQEETGDRDEE